MRFTTIWTTPAMTFSERLKRTREWAAMGAARHLPQRIRYWVTALEIGKATMDSPDIMATPLDEVLKKLDRPKSMA